MVPFTGVGQSLGQLKILSYDCDEYKEVERLFNASMAKDNNYSSIQSIQHLQNTLLYSQYNARKKEMVKQNPSGHENEKWLFHRILSEDIDGVSARGFGYSLITHKGELICLSQCNVILFVLHTLEYGHGVYFAREAASYSIGYDEENIKFKYMYLAQVLTGEYTVGDRTMQLPPSKDPYANTHILFDSTVDSMSNPSWFVTYFNNQSYPVYLIKFICSSVD